MEIFQADIHDFIEDINMYKSFLNEKFAFNYYASFGYYTKVQNSPLIKFEVTLDYEFRNFLERECTARKNPNAYKDYCHRLAGKIMSGVMKYRNYSQYCEFYYMNGKELVLFDPNEYVIIFKNKF